MTRSASLATICIAVFVLSFASLVTGAAWLEITPLQAFPLPLGNLVAEIVFVSLAALPLLATRSGTPARVAAWLLLAAAVLWLPVSAMLAGNLDLNFSGWRGEVWLFYTYRLLPVGILLLLLWQLVRRVLHRRRPTEGARPGSSVTGNSR